MPSPLRCSGYGTGLPQRDKGSVWWSSHECMCVCSDKIDMAERNKVALQSAKRKDRGGETRHYKARTTYSNHCLSSWNSTCLTSGPRAPVQSLPALLPIHRWQRIPQAKERRIGPGSANLGLFTDFTVHEETWSAMIQKSSRYLCAPGSVAWPGPEGWSRRMPLHRRMRNYRLYPW